VVPSRHRGVPCSFELIFRFQIISETLRQFLALGTTARRFQKLMLNHPKAYDDLITRCCLALSNRNEIAALKMAVTGFTVFIYIFNILDFRRIHNSKRSNPANNWRYKRYYATLLRLL
jgi:hypothetical protein